MQARAFVLGLGLGGFLLGGCAYGEVRQVVRAQFASDFDCPEVLLKKRELWYSYEGPDQFKAMGCGKVRTYTCPANTGRVSYDEPVCTFVDGDADAPKTVKMNTDPGADESEPMMDDTGGGDTGDEMDSPPPSSDDSGGDTDSDSESEPGDDLGGEADADGEASSSHGAASGAASGGIRLGGGAKAKGKAGK